MEKKKRIARADRIRAVAHLIGQAEDIGMWRVGAYSVAKWLGVSQSYADDLLKYGEWSGVFRCAVVDYRPNIKARYYALRTKSRELYEEGVFKSSYIEQCPGNAKVKENGQ